MSILVSNLVSASKTMPGADIDVYLVSDQPELGKVKCRVHRRHETQGWLVAYCGSTLMQAVWSFSHSGWVFSTEDCEAITLAEQVHI